MYAVWFSAPKKIDGDTLFFEYMFKKFTSYIIKKKIVVPMNAERDAWWVLLALRLLFMKLMVEVRPHFHHHWSHSQLVYAL